MYLYLEDGMAIFLFGTQDACVEVSSPGLKSRMYMYVYVDTDHFTGSKQKPVNHIRLAHKKTSVSPPVCKRRRSSQSSSNTTSKNVNKKALVCVHRCTRYYTMLSFRCLTLNMALPQFCFMAMIKWPHVELWMGMSAG